MQIRPINADDAVASPGGGFSQAVEVVAFSRLVFVSGQVPVAPDGSVPADFEDQCRLAWRNVGAQLGAAGMTLDNVVKVTTFLADRAYGLANRTVRREVLGDRRPASTVVVVDIFDSDWLLEIEVIAAA